MNNPDCKREGTLMERASACQDPICYCMTAIVVGCTCGLYFNQIRRNAGHHTDDCGIFKEKA